MRRHELPLGGDHRKRIRRMRAALPPVALGAAISVILLLFSRGVWCSNHLKTSKIVLLDNFAGLAASQRSASATSLRRLVLVAGHAIYRGAVWTRDALVDEENWILETFQHGQVPSFLAHIERGAAIAANDSSSLLVFSGGQTRASAGPRSEAGTYWQAADALGWAGNPKVASRATTEEYARDSFENLLYAVCRFRQWTGHYPETIDVVSFEFKRRRFVDVHRAALRYPGSRFRFIGVDPPGSDNAAMGEMKNSMGPFADDPHGCNKEVLRKKKLERNPYRRYAPYPQGCDEIAPLFSHCGHSIYDGKLPWDGWDKTR